jgi:hypothetical protein
MVTAHEGVAVEPAQHRPFPAQCFAEEKSLGARMKEARRMKLIKFHVGDFGPRPKRHRYPVAARHVGIRRVEVHLARAAGGEQRRAREHRIDGAGGIVEHVGPHALIGAAELRHEDEIDPRPLLEDADTRVIGDRIEKRPLHLAPGHVRGVGDAPCTVASLAPEIEVGVGLGGARARELHADLAQHRDPPWPLAHAEVDHHVVAEAGPRRHRIGDMRGEGVALGEHAGNPPLRVLGVRLVATALGHDDDVTVLGRLQRKRQPGNAATEH